MRLAILIISIWTYSCGGVNTQTPVLPFIFFNPPGVPQLVGVVPTAEYTGFTDPYSAFTVGQKPEYILKYYVTNTEPQFIGYNLFITSALPTLADTQAGAGTYLENGVPPSFPHSTLESSTQSSSLIKRKIANRIPAPGIYPFQKCEIFSFTMRAVFSNGITSNPSVSVGRCASLAPFLCEVGSSCNPSQCNSSTCTSDQQLNCPVGTLCNPCKLSPNQWSGCECPSGVSPPGCNP